MTSNELQTKINNYHDKLTVLAEEKNMILLDIVILQAAKFAIEKVEENNL